MTPLDDLFERHPVLQSVRSATMAAFALLGHCAASGGTIYVCGNGGSAADAEHIVGELMKGLARRRPLPAADRTALLGAATDGLEPDARYLADHLDGAVRAVCLSSQSSLLTAVVNDLGADVGFAQQVFGYGRPGDVLWAISTSGRSRNVVLAALAARARSMPVVALTGADGGDLGGLATVCIQVPATDVGAAQELHRPVYHALCRALEDACFPLDPDGAP
jgi:D-sedoheptulose 7-phosphate isomerase